MTGKASQEAAAAEREWRRTRSRFRNDTVRYGFGTDAAKAAWKQRIQKTRSF